MQFIVMNAVNTESMPIFKLSKIKVIVSSHENKNIKHFIFKKDDIGNVDQTRNLPQ